MNTKINTIALARIAGASALALGVVLAFAPAYAADKELKLVKVAAPVVVGSTPPAGGGGFSIKSVVPKAPRAEETRQIIVEPKGLVAPKAPTAPVTANLEIPKAPTAPSTGVARIELPKAERPKVASATPFISEAPAQQLVPAQQLAAQPQAEAAPAPEAAPIAPIAPKPAPSVHHNSYSAYYGYNGHGGYYVQKQPTYYGGGYGYRGGYGGFRNCH